MLVIGYRVFRKILRGGDFVVLKQELRVYHVEASSAIQTDCSARLTEVVHELRIADQADWHVIARKLDCSSEDLDEVLS